MRRKNVMAVISILVMLGATQQALAQCNWSTKVVLTHHTRAQPGLVASGDRLILTWAGSNNGRFNSLISFNGVNWSNHVIRSDFPLIAEQHSGGVGMAYSPPCGGVYVGWRTTGNAMYATKSVDGINWDGAYWISGSALSAPALRGDNGLLPIGFAFSTYSSTPGYDGLFEAYKGKFNCDFSNPVFPSQECFFNDNCAYFHGQSGAWTPVWTGAGGTTELSAIATGPPPIGGGITSTIIVQVNDDHRPPLDPHWSNNGLAGTINPNDGTPYIAWTCHPGEGDTCRPESTGKINLFNVNTRAFRGCADWSVYNPVMTFFQGKIWVAWRGGSSGGTGYINIASIDPF